MRASARDCAFDAPPRLFFIGSPRIRRLAAPMHILFVVPYISTNARICLQALCSLDIRLGIISQEGAERFPDDLRKRVEGHYRVNDAMDAAQLVAAGKAFLKQWGRVDRLIGFLEQLQVPLAVAREALGIGGMGESVALNFREKNRMKQVLREAGLPVARQALLTNSEEARAFVAKVGYPIVVKPPAGLGARATMRVSSASELEDALETLMVSPSNPAQAEEFIQGDEHTFETVTIDGKHVWHSSSYYLPSPLQVLENPWMQYCVLLPREQLPPHAERFRNLNIRALDALGMKTGLSHMEWFSRADGSPVISEVGARPPGIHLMPMMGYAHDVNMWQKWVELMVYHRFSMPERRYACGVAFFRGQGTGQVVRAVEGLDAAQALAGRYVVDRQIPKVGMMKASGYEGEGWAIVRADTTKDALEALKALVSHVRVVLG